MLILHLTKSEKNKQNSIFPTSYPKKINKMYKFWFTGTILSQILKVINI